METADREISIDTPQGHAGAQGDLDFLNDRQLAFLVNTELEHEFAADAALMSVRTLDEGKEFRGGDVSFTPALPRQKRKAIEALAMGVLNHVLEHRSVCLRVILLPAARRQIGAPAALGTRRQGSPVLRRRGNQSRTPRHRPRRLSLRPAGRQGNQGALAANMPIIYSSSRRPTLDQVIELYRISTLGERRPIEDRHVMQGMIDNSDLIVTAWDEGELVGIARTLTDYTYCAYLADLAVHIEWQRRGIGVELIEITKRCLEPTCFVTLLSAPAANDYYPRVGFEHNPRAWTWWPPR